MSEEIRDGRPDSVVTIWHDTTRKLALVFFPLFGLMLVAAHTLITFLYTNRFAASVPIFMVWSTVVLLATMPAESVLRVYAQVRYLFVVKTVCLAFVVSLIYFFLMHFGLMGAVFVTILASCLAKTLCMVRMKKMMQVPVRQLLPWTSLAAVLGTTVISSTIAFAIQYLADVPALVSLCLTGGAMVTTYSGLLLTFGLLSASERAFFMRKVQQGIAFLRREPDVRSEVEV